VPIDRSARNTPPFLPFSALKSVSWSGVPGSDSGGRQAILARLLPALEVRPLDQTLGRQAGVLLGAAGAADVIDAAVVLLAHDGDDIYTSDPTDLTELARAAGRHVEIIPV
jgi:hypothetical protein